ncbi:dTDP-4-dehydrorhamnose 3,5-epimerase [Halopseudomonas oceani]|uniref:dTDP-4-dehydrorhamnose 3,5-epimerase n=1 Tax=Halopseudomonas oceani TaxID=1708783 RepID=A0A2P4EWL7_9GAMM|nr:dTDP-4-dehydrorhamnose 3,5-epimerase [Halopseudomonas oceani]POB04354.1 dTDP-4-dehydrorhamnose 3,5-epimerase [Halopseudomonas oceani]GGE31696.1 dTDP-4-dehydrorhamnose 3,5-epimerase [Halopseudomonas oceani]
MKVQQTTLPGVLLLQPQTFGDERGFFLESFQSQRYRDIGIELPFVQDNHSRSGRGVLRGLHFQRTRPQGKLVRVSRGSVFDVVVDINPQSATFGQHVAATLSDENHLQMWIPPGYAHGFCVTSDVADFEYKCTDYYLPSDEGGVLWSDPELAIEWPVADPILSDKDRNHPLLRALIQTENT